MKTMRGMNPDAPNFVNATNAASVYGDFISKPKYAETEKFLQNLIDQRDKVKLEERLLLQDERQSRLDEQNKQLFDLKISDIDRANKKERISSILSQITDIKQLSFNYYQLNATDPDAIELGLIIPARIQQLNHFINRACCQNQVLSQPISKKFIKFRRALTGGTFGSGQRVSLPITDNLYQKIIRAELDLYIEIEKLLP